MQKHKLVFEQRGISFITMVSATFLFKIGKHVSSARDFEWLNLWNNIKCLNFLSIYSYVEVNWKVTWPKTRNKLDTTFMIQKRNH